MTAPCQATNPRVSPVEHTRVFTSQSAMTAHLVRHSDEGAALCGAAPELSVVWPGWYGTGSQLEYEHAAALPICPKCDRKANA